MPDSSLFLSSLRFHKFLNALQQKKIFFFSILSCLCLLLFYNQVFALNKSVELLSRASMAGRASNGLSWLELIRRAARNEAPTLDHTLLGHSVSQSAHSSVLIEALKKQRSNIQCNNCEVSTLRNIKFLTGEAFLTHVVDTMRHAPSFNTKKNNLRGYMCAKCGKVTWGNNALGISGHNSQMARGGIHDTPAQFIFFHVQHDTKQLTLKYFDYSVNKKKALVEVFLPLESPSTAAKSKSVPLSATPPKAITTTAGEQLTVVTASSGEGAAKVRTKRSRAAVDGGETSNTELSLNWLDQTGAIPDEYKGAMNRFLRQKIHLQQEKMRSSGSKKIYLLPSQVRELHNALKTDNIRGIQTAYTKWATKQQATIVNENYLKNWMSRVRGRIIGTQPIMQRQVAGYSVTNKVMPESLYDFLIEQGHMSPVKPLKKARR